MSTIQAIGGHGPIRIVVGGKTVYNNMNARDTWEAHLRLGNKEFTIKTINEILELPEYVEDDKLLCQVLKQIWEAPIEKLFYGIARRLDLDESMGVARRTLFWKFKEFIEAIVTVHLKTVQQVNIQKEFTMWRNKVKSNNVDTSSIILWSLFCKESPSYKKYFKNINFEYLGYCPKAPTERINALLSFPTDQLIYEIMQKNNNFNVIDFKKINEYMDIFDREQFNISQVIESCKKPDLEDSTTVSKYLNNFMETWLNLNDCLKPYLEEYEEVQIRTAKQMDTISAELEKITISVLQQL
jgi:preprotein translocase subunit Sss1